MRFRLIHVIAILCSPRVVPPSYSIFTAWRKSQQERCHIMNWYWVECFARRTKFQRGIYKAAAEQSKEVHEHECMVCNEKLHVQNGENFIVVALKVSAFRYTFDGLAHGLVRSHVLRSCSHNLTQLSSLASRRSCLCQDAYSGMLNTYSHCASDSYVKL